MKEQDDIDPVPSPEELEKALTAFHRGSTAELEALLGESEHTAPSVVKSLRLAVDQKSGREMDNRESSPT